MPEPWVLQGAELQAEERDLIARIPLYLGAIQVFQLRVATLFNAPSPFIASIIDNGDARIIFQLGFGIWSCEWAYLSAIYFLQAGRRGSELDDSLAWIAPVSEGTSVPQQ